MIDLLFFNGSKHTKIKLEN